MHQSWLFVIGIEFVICSGCGNSRDVPANKYTGTFEVRNESQIEIRNVEFSGFGGACPVGKHYRAGRSSIARFPSLRTLPEKSTVTWTEDDTSTEKSQELEVANQIPRGQDGSIVFRFGKEMIWDTFFEPENPENTDKVSRGQ